MNEKSKKTATCQKKSIINCIFFLIILRYSKNISRKILNFSNLITRILKKKIILVMSIYI